MRDLGVGKESFHERCDFVRDKRSTTRPVGETLAGGIPETVDEVSEEILLSDIEVSAPASIAEVTQGLGETKQGDVARSLVRCAARMWVELKGRAAKIARWKLAGP
jgi:hypothetical protein